MTRPADNRTAWRCSDGSVALLAGLALPLLLVGVGVAVDYTLISRQKAVLQTIADGAAIAGARELSLASDDMGHIEAAAGAYIDHEALRARAGFATDLVGKVQIDLPSGKVTAVVEQNWQPLFAHFIDTSSTRIESAATAQVLVGANICVLGLNENGSKNVFLKGDATITGQDCGVFSNSTDPSAIQAEENGSIAASLICAAGGSRGAARAFRPGPTHDCPSTEDPLLSRPEPDVGGCDYNETEIKDQIVTLSPGVYCGGLRISGSAQVRFSPGVYVIKGGPFLVTDSASVTGEGAGFYLADGKAQFEFTEDTSVQLKAPKDGPLAGILFFETRQANKGQMHRIRSNDARVLVGTIYLPKGRFMVESRAPVGAESEYTAVVVGSLELIGTPNLVLNTNYDQTDIPAPTGLIGGRVVLAH